MTMQYILPDVPVTKLDSKTCFYHLKIKYLKYILYFIRSEIFYFDFIICYADFTAVCRCYQEYTLLSSSNGGVECFEKEEFQFVCFQFSDYR